MCEVPPRRLRSGLTATRILLAVTAVTIVVVGMQVEDFPGLLVVGLGLAVLLTAVLFPIIRQIECGFPSGVKITAALQNREDDLRKAFETQKGDLGVFTQLLCDDPALAAQLLEAAWSRTAATWRGPVTSQELRLYVLCLYVHLLDKHRRLTGPGDAETTSSAGPLAALAPTERTVVVLREFMELPVAQIAALTERPTADVVQDLRAAQAALARTEAPGGGS